MPNTGTAKPESVGLLARGTWSPTNLALAAIYGLPLGLPWGAMLASQYVTGDAAWQNRVPLLLTIALAAMPWFRRTRVRWLLLLFPVLFVVNVALAYVTIIVLRSLLGVPTNPN